MLLKLNLVLFFMLAVSVVPVNGQTTSQLASPSVTDIRSNADKTAMMNDAVLNEYSLGTFKTVPQSRPLSTSFNCGSGLVYIITNKSSSNGNISGLYSFDLATKTQTLIKDPLIDSTTSSQFVNGIGYNVVDNFIYGHLQGTDQITKIDALGNIEFLTITGDFSIGDYSSGDVDHNGILYIYGKGRFVAINLNPSAPDFMEAKTLLVYSATFHDLTFNSVDGNIYMVTSDSTRTLLRFNVNSNTISTLGNVNGLEGESTDSFGTAFMDGAGNMYISNNASGNIYKIATPHNGGLDATPFNTLFGTPGDGARCPNESVPPNAFDDQACGIIGENIIIDLIKNDGSGSYPIELSSVKLIDPITNNKVTTVTVAGQGTFTVDNKGIMTFTPLATFTDASITYTMEDQVGIVSNEASISVSLNTTIAPTGTSVQEFCSSNEPTIANLKATGSSIKWYASEDSTTPLRLSLPLEEKTYYATQTSEAGCESLERFAVTVNMSQSISLIDSGIATCSSNKSDYVLEVKLNGTQPFNVNGPGAPGVFKDNGDNTFSWVSNPIPASIKHYSIEFGDSCNTIVLNGDAPFDCLETAFNCDEGLAFILTNTGNDQDNYVTGLYTLNLATNVQNLVKYPLIEDTTSPHRFINGIGYNILDNYLYGLLQYTNKIVRIDTVGDIEYFDITGSFTPGYYSSGDMDDNGNLYLYNGSKIVSINLVPGNPDYLVANDLINYSASVNDLTYNTLDGNIYMVTSTSSPELLRYNLSANVVENLGTLIGLEAETTSSFGTAFMDSMGNLFIANNASGNIYKISSPESGGITAVFYSGAMEGLQPGDGARCQNQITLPVANDDSVCGILDADTLINVLANDGAGSYTIDVSSVTLINPVTLESSTSVTIDGQGTFTADANGIVTFTPLATFTEASVQYFIKDILTNESQPATITIKLNVFEVTCPTFAESTVECYGDLPSKTNYTITEFEALGNGDGFIESSSCGIIVITAANSADNGSCAQTVTRTYTITEYLDTNRNGILDEGETTVLNSSECVQLINVQDTIAPSLVTEYETEITITCDNIPEVPELVFEDACSNNIQVEFTETSTAANNTEDYVITRTWTVFDNCENESVYTQIINVNSSNSVKGGSTELCNDENLDFDLFSLLSGNYSTDGTWSVVTGNVVLDGSIFNPYQMALNTYTFKYNTEDEYCPTETLVSIKITDDCVVMPCGIEDVVISKAVTTYADGKNDFFTITGVESCGFTYEVQIFNRWGALIYESNDYQNDWNGTTSKASVGSANYVPTGTYYYIVNLKNSGLKPFAGPIYVATK